MTENAQSNGTTRLIMSMLIAFAGGLFVATLTLGSMLYGAVDERAKDAVRAVEQLRTDLNHHINDQDAHVNASWKQRMWDLLRMTPK